MDQDALLAITSEIRTYGEALKTLREALEKLDGWEVKAACGEVAIALFQLGEAAAQQSPQKHLA